MQAAMRPIVPAVLAIAVLAALPAPASAVTVKEIVALSKAGVSEPIILALIERDQTILTISPEQVIALKHEGVSEAVVLAMLRSGRQPPPEAAPPPPIATPLPAQLTYADVLEPPNLIIVGHGPDRPNTAHNFDRIPFSYYYSSAYDVPIVIPVPYTPNIGRGHFRRGVRPSIPPHSVTMPQNPLSRPPTFVPSTGIFFQTPFRGQFFDRE